MERNDLAPYAARSVNSRGRRYQEPFKDDRPAFERDRDRIIHCAAFRRLEYKTQVFVNHEGDYYRTRLTHSLEVAQIARGTARKLRLNEDLVEALSLAHDLGHTPFGHTGEQVLNHLMADYGGFEHNRQSLRVVEVLEERYPHFNGLNLCWETREGIIKHSSDYDKAPDDAVAEYDLGKFPTFEAQIIDLADEIAYNNHDIDDGLKSGYITTEELSELALWRETHARVAGKFPGIDSDRHIYQTISHLIGTLIDDLIGATSDELVKNRITHIDDVFNCSRRLVSFSPEMRRKNNELKLFLRKKLYRHYKVERMRIKAERILHALFASYQQTPSLLPSACQEKFIQHGKERTIGDYIAGMTDRYAMDEYKRLFDPYERV